MDEADQTLLTVLFRRQGCQTHRSGTGRGRCRRRVHRDEVGEVKGVRKGYVYRCPGCWLCCCMCISTAARIKYTEVVLMSSHLDIRCSAYDV